MSTISFIADIVTFLGFTFTCWQLVSLKRIIRKEKESARQEQIDQEHLATVSEALSLIELIHEFLINSDDRLALLKAEELNKLLCEVREEKRVLEYARSNFSDLLDNFTQRIIALREAIRIKEAYDARFMMSNLQYIKDNLKLVQQQLKQHNHGN